MSVHPTIAGCYTYRVDVPNEPQHPACPTCGANEREVLEIDIPAYSRHYGMDDQNPETHRAAVQHVRSSAASPKWVKDAEPDHQSAAVTMNGPLACNHQGVIREGSTISGRNNQVSVDNVPLSPRRSQEVHNHSPDGFSWGYAGSAPAQLALALMLEAGASDREATQIYQDFKRAHITTLDMDKPFQMAAQTVLGWLESHRRQQRRPPRTGKETAAVP